MGFHNAEVTKNSSRIKIVYEGPIIVGAGPSGLATAACLKKQGIPSLIIERSNCIASLWQQKTYDRLKLHLPKKFCELPLMGFPANFPKYPSKKQFISYMENYAINFNLNPKFNTEVESAKFDEETMNWRVIIKGDEIEYVSKWLIVATGENAEPLIPEIQGIEKFSGKLVHTSLYKSGNDFGNQRVWLLGVEILEWKLVWTFVGMMLCLTWWSEILFFSVQNYVHILPREMFGLSTFGVAMALLKWFPLRLVDKFLLLVANLTLGNTDQVGLRRPKTGPLELKNATGKTPVLDVGAFSLIKSGKIKVIEGVKEITKNGAKFTDGQEREFDSIILATGYKSNVPFWLKDCEFFSDDGMPKVPFPNGWKGGKGLYTVGFTRRGLLGTASDAIQVAKDIADQWRTIKGHNEILYS
ncbi:putative indole-3-pyruvate monooxygenase YUCCA4 [Bienertia sinuspersici]